MTRKPNKKRRQQRQRTSRQADHQGQPSPPPPPAEPIVQSGLQANGSQTQQQRGPDQDEREDRRAIRRYTLWQTLFAGCIVIFTVGQVIVGHWQWDATDKQWKSMERQLALMALDQRPWLQIDAEVDRELQADTPFNFNITVSNFGRAAATLTGQVTVTAPLLVPEGTSGVGTFEMIEGTRMVKIDEDLLADMEAKIMNGQISQVVAPGAKTAITPGGQMPLKDEWVDKINNGAIIVVVVVLVDYLGPTEEKYRTRSCYIYDAATQTCKPYVRYNYMR